MTGTLVQRIARWVLDFEPAAADARAVELIKHSILDAIGCAVLTLDEACVAGVRAHGRAVGGAPQASLIGGGQAPLAMATLVNGALIRAIDFNDHLALDPRDGTKRGGHPSDNLAAVLATAEWCDRPGREVIAALLAGYELYGRLYRFLTPELPWDHTTAFGITVPALAARLLGLDAEQAAHAIALSAAQAASLGVVRRGELSHSKFLASALAAQRGVEATQLAAAGVTGPMTVFEDSRGIAAGIFHTDDIDSLVAPPAPVHMVEGVTIKGYPGMDTSQAAAEAAIRVAAGRRLRSADIHSIALTMNDHPMIREQSGDPRRRAPNSRETADHSIHYMVAVALLDGEMTPRQFAENRWFDPDVCDLMQRMTIELDPAWNLRAPGGFPCAIRVKTRDGAELVAEVAFATGHARNKMSGAQVVEKFNTCVERRLTAVAARDIVAVVDALDAAPSIRSLTRLLAVAGP